MDADPFDNRTNTTKCWLLFMIVFCSAIILFTLPSSKKGGADEIRSAIYPALVMIGSVVMVFGVPSKMMMYNSSFFTLLDDGLPYTATLSVVVWLGFLRMEGGVTTSVFLYNIAGILWSRHFFGR
jgi:uncharacterized membrane protein